MDNIFWLKVEPGSTDECWPWTGAINNHGYGALTYEGKHYMAHRLAWQLVNGDIPEGYEILHQCDNKICCNPYHLETGTHKENMQQMGKMKTLRHKGDIAELLKKALQL